MKKLGLDLYDGLAVLGFGAFEYGVGQWSRPAAWVFGGIVLIAIAIWPDLRKVKR